MFEVCAEAGNSGRCKESSDLDKTLVQLKIKGTIRHEVRKHSSRQSYQSQIFFLYFVEELVGCRLCSRCSPVSWCRMSFAICAGQQSQEKHSCVLDLEVGFLETDDEL